MLLQFWFVQIKKYIWLAPSKGGPNYLSASWLLFAAAGLFHVYVGLYLAPCLCRLPCNNTLCIIVYIPQGNKILGFPQVSIAGDLQGNTYSPNSLMSSTGISSPGQWYITTSTSGQTSKCRLIYADCFSAKHRKDTQLFSKLSCSCSLDLIQTGLSQSMTTKKKNLSLQGNIVLTAILLLGTAGK